MWAVTKKELKNYFLSPIGYIYIGIFLMACSLFFYLDIFQYLETDFYYMFGSSVTVLTFIVPLLTMRMFAEERKNGTEQLLLTSPKSITQIVLGKFLAATIVVVISALLTLIHFAILSYFGKPDVATSLIAILGFTLLSIAYVSFGMFASSLTENQIIAAVISIGFFLLSWFLPGMVTNATDFSLMNAFYSSFMNGTISIANTVLLISYTVMFIIFTIITIQKRKYVK